MIFNEKVVDEFYRFFNFTVLLMWRFIMISLEEIAINFNEIAQKMQVANSILINGRVEMGKLLIEAHKRLKEQGDRSFEEWCRNNLKKADGGPFSYSTIKNYMRFARCPASLAADKKQKREYQRKSRLALQCSSFSQPVGKLSLTNQVNRLIEDWNHSSDLARSYFLDHINALPKPNVAKTNVAERPKEKSLLQKLFWIGSVESQRECSVGN